MTSTGSGEFRTIGSRWLPRKPDDKISIIIIPLKKGYQSAGLTSQFTRRLLSDEWLANRRGQSDSANPQRLSLAMIGRGSRFSSLDRLLNEGKRLLFDGQFLWCSRDYQATSFRKLRVWVQTLVQILNFKASEIQAPKWCERFYFLELFSFEFFIRAISQPLFPGIFSLRAVHRTVISRCRSR